MKAYFNYNLSKNVQLVIENEHREEVYVSRMYSDSQDLINALNESNIESEEQEKKQLDIV